MSRKEPGFRQEDRLRRGVQSRPVPLPKGQSVFGRLLGWWVAAIQNGAQVAHLLTIWLILIPLELAFLAWHPRLNLGQLLFTELLVIWCACAVPVSLTYVALRHHFRPVVDMLTAGPRAGGDVMWRLVLTQLRSLSNLSDKMTGRGVDARSVLAKEWLPKTCFDIGSSEYIGVDRHPPGAFMQEFGCYLQAQAAFQERRGTNSLRIIVADESALRIDERRNPELVSEFYEWHETHGVRLAVISFSAAESLSLEIGLGGETDVAIWDEGYAIVWDYRRPTEPLLRLTMLGDAEFRRCKAYVSELERRSIPLDARGAGIPLRSGVGS